MRVRGAGQEPLRIRSPAARSRRGCARREPAITPDRLRWVALIAAVAGYAAWRAVDISRPTLSLRRMSSTRRWLRFITLVRVIVLIALATLIWVPVGVWIGLRPKLAERIQPLAQFLAAFPANLACSAFVVIIVRYGLTPTSGCRR